MPRVTVLDLARRRPPAASARAHQAPSILIFSGRMLRALLARVVGCAHFAIIIYVLTRATPSSASILRSVHGMPSADSLSPRHYLRSFCREREMTRSDVLVISMVPCMR